MSGALFSALARTPISEIILVVEMTQNLLILPLMITCLISTTEVQLARDALIDTQLLRGTLKMKLLHEMTIEFISMMRHIWNTPRNIKCIDTS
jgi:H+/Cl- antiporter ClcA